MQTNVKQCNVEDIYLGEITTEAGFLTILDRPDFSK